jgi:hypothetical protein
VIPIPRDSLDSLRAAVGAADSAQAELQASIDRASPTVASFRATAETMARPFVRRAHELQTRALLRGFDAVCVRLERCLALCSLLDDPDARSKLIDALNGVLSRRGVGRRVVAHGEPETMTLAQFLKLATPERIAK